MSVMPLAVALLWPAMLPWLVATALPLVLAWWAVRDARRIRWAAIELVEQAARAARITRSGLPWPLTLVRMLVIACIALAATRPFLGDNAGSRGRPVVAGQAATRIEIVVPAGRDDAAVQPIRRAIEAVARTRPRSSPTVALVTLGEAGRSTADRSLVILGDGSVPGADDAARLTAAVRAGASLLVCLGPASVASPGLSRIAAWLDDLAGVSVAGSLSLDDEAIEAADTRERPSSAGFVTLPGPRVARVADLILTGAETVGVTVLARSATAGRPLVVERRAERGRVCVSALPLALPPTGAGATAWSDLAAWPAFVPFVDRLVSGLLLPPDEADKQSPRSWRRFAGLPLARLLLACGLVLAIVEALMVLRRAGAGGQRPGPVTMAARGLIFLSLVGMIAAWGGRPPDGPTKASKPRSVAVVIDVSPSMAAMDGPATVEASTSRLRTLFAAALPGGPGAGILDRLARERSVEIHAAAEHVRRLGQYPAEVSAADLRQLAAAPSATDASRLGDAVAAVIERSGAGGPAAVVVMSDGAISGGASWGEAADLAARRGVPLVAVPVGDDASGASGLPTGLRFTALDVPAIVRPNERIAIPVRGVAATMSRTPLMLCGEGSEAAFVVHPSPGAAGYDYEGLFIVPPIPATSERGTGFDAPDLPETAAPTARPVTRTLTLAVGDDDGSHAATAPIIIADDPIRVLLVDRGPRYEFRFLERLLSSDSRYAVTCRLLPAHGAEPLRFTDAAPQSVADWKTFDVVVLGDVPLASVAEEGMAAWEGLREAVVRHGVGLAWLPGRRWAEADAGRTTWLPAVIGTVGPAAAEPTLPRQLRVLPSGRATGWFSVPGATGDGAVAFGPVTFSPLPSLEIRPTARVVAVMEAKDRARSAPAIIVDRVGQGTIVGHACDTWRWRSDEASGAATDHARYWHHLLPRLAERRRVGRLVAATMAVRPLDPIIGEAVRMDVMPTRPTIDLTGWNLEIESPDEPARRLGCGEQQPGSIATLRLTGLAAGRHRLRLVPADSAGGNLPTTSIEREIVVNEPRVERAVGPAGTGPMRAAVEAGGGAVVSPDRLETLPDAIAAVANPQNDRGAVDGRWLMSPSAAHLLLATFIAACVASWWPQPAVTS